MADLANCFVQLTILFTSTMDSLQFDYASTISSLLYYHLHYVSYISHCSPGSVSPQLRYHLKTAGTPLSKKVPGPLFYYKYDPEKGSYIVGSRGASQLGGSLRGIPPGYKANKLSLSYPLGIIRTLV